MDTTMDEILAMVEQHPSASPGQKIILAESKKVGQKIKLKSNYQLPVKRMRFPQAKSPKTTQKKVASPERSKTMDKPTPNTVRIRKTAV